MHRKTIILSSIILVISFCSLSFAEDPLYKNLKVLKKNISHDELEIVMKEFTTALGVKCSFCHAESKTDPGKRDFVSDDNKHKDIARSMMRMTTRINKKFFKDSKEPAVTCFGCHNGNKEPKAPPKEVLE